MKTWTDLGLDVSAASANAAGEVYTTCPKCSSERKKKHAKCLSANVRSEVWICHHCGWSGTLKDGWREPQVVHWRKPVYTRPDPRPVSELPDRVLDYFSKRGISAQTLTACSVSYERVYMPQEEDWVNAIVFPYTRNGELINRKYRDGRKNFRMEAGAERIFYNVDALLVHENIIIVEGEIDAISLMEAGFDSVVSVPDGAPDPSSKHYAAKFDFLASAEDALGKIKSFTLAVDNDAPGRVLEDELSRRLGKERCRRVIWPEGCKDANDVLARLGGDALRDCIADAEPYPVEGIIYADALREAVIRFYDQPVDRGLSTGWRAMDEFYRVHMGELTVISGIPNSGKSNWADNVIVNLARAYGMRFGMFSPENQPELEHCASLVEKWSGLPFRNGPHYAKMERSTLDAGIQWVQDHLFWIKPDDDSEWTIDQILSKARALVLRHGIQGLLLDPWNEVEHLRPAAITETEYVSQQLKHIRQFARRYQIHAWLVVHPAKLFRDKDGNYPVPTLYDCAGSAHFRNKADNGIVLWRDFRLSDGTAEVHVQKIRFRRTGKLGVATLRYDVATGIFHDVLGN